MQREQKKQTAHLPVFTWERSICIVWKLLPEASLAAQTVRNLPAVQKTWLNPGVGKTPGEGDGNPFHILAWGIPWTEETGGLQSMGLQRVRLNWGTNTPEGYVPKLSHIQGLSVITPEDHRHQWTPPCLPAAGYKSLVSPRKELLDIPAPLLLCCHLRNGSLDWLALTANRASTHGTHENCS